MIKHKNNNILKAPSIELLGGFQSSVRPDRWEETAQRIREQTPPLTNKQLWKLGYLRSKELPKLVRRYTTYYVGKDGPDQDLLFFPHNQKTARREDSINNTHGGARQDTEYNTGRKCKIWKSVAVLGAGGGL